MSSSYFWEQFTAEELQKIDLFKINLNRINDTMFVNVYDRPNLYTIADESGINLRECQKEGIMLQALWVFYLKKLKEMLPPSELKYANLTLFLQTYPEFRLKPAQEQVYLWHTANWMVELFKMIPAYKNKGLAMIIVPKLVEGWEAKYITGSGQKDSTISRVKIFESEGNVKPNTRAKHTWVTDMSAAAKAKHASSSIGKTKPIKIKQQHPVNNNNNIRSKGLRQGVLRSYDDYDMTDEDNESVSSVSLRSSSVDQTISVASSMVMDTSPLPLPLSQTDEECFLQALALFRQGSGSVLLERAHSLSLSRAVSGMGMTSFDWNDSGYGTVSPGAVIDFSVTDSFAPSSPRWTFVDV